MILLKYRYAFLCTPCRYFSWTVLDTTHRFAIRHTPAVSLMQCADKTAFHDFHHTGEVVFGPSNNPFTRSSACVCFWVLFDLVTETLCFWPRRVTFWSKNMSHPRPYRMLTSVACLQEIKEILPEQV